MVRRFAVLPPEAKKVSIVVDASPWGAGGMILVDGSPASWFSEKFRKADEEALGIAFGSSDCQQVAEALAILFALRLWFPTWADISVVLEVKSDSVTALTLVASMKATSRSMSAVAREVALTLAESGVRPRICSHTPGIANKIADVLSRRFQPDTSWAIPACLHHAKEMQLPAREKDYYRAVVPPR